ncbi:MAG: hypothetical protein J1G04_01810 [Clostridiales bacterium]|nr:hypothetical protein [Clostridiales bacterium]
MGKTELRGKRFIVSIIIICVLALCIGIGAFLCFAKNQKSTVNDGAPSSVIGDHTSDGQKHFTFGQTYTIGGKQYTLGEKEDEFIDYHTVLGLDPDEYIVTLTKFTYPSGKDGTDKTTSIRNAGKYEFEVEPLAADAQPYNDIVVLDSQVVHVNVNDINAFTNATTPTNRGPTYSQAITGYAAHGDITTIYQHNNGWYAAQIDNNSVVNTRTITNSYYSYSSGKNIPIMIMGEDLTTENPKSSLFGTDSLKPTRYPDTASSTSYSNYLYVTDGKEIKIRITNRSGTVFGDSGEYVASFQFNFADDNYNISKSENYIFDYTNESALSESYRGLSVPEETRTTTSFVLKKYWYIVKGDKMIALPGYKNGNEPYVPFAYRPDDETFISSSTDEGSPNFDGKNGYTLEDFAKPGGDAFAILDTITYGDDIYINEPRIKVDGVTNVEMQFKIDYLSPDGAKTTIKEKGELLHVVTWVQDKQNDNKWTHSDNGAAKDSPEKTIAYYINKSMPAGTYTLYVYMSYDSGNHSVTGEYKLYVLPKAFDSEALSDLHDVIRGQEVNKGQGDYRNSRPLGAETLHDDITVAGDGGVSPLAKLNGTLKYTTKGSRIGYWKTISDKENAELYDTEVTIMYSRGDGYAGGADFSEKEIAGSFATPKTYDVYYSIYAKNYAYVGGANSKDFEHYGFNIWMFDGADVKEIYDLMKQEGGIYYHGGTYTGNDVLSTAYVSSYYDASPDKEDGMDYKNVGVAYIRLILRNKTDTFWDTSKLPHSNEGGDWFEKYYKDYFKIEGDDLLVYYTITPANNEWTVAPKLPSWYYDGFSQEDNIITGDLKFLDSQDKVQFRLGRKKSGVEGADQYEWLKIEDGEEGAVVCTFDDKGTYFNVDDKNQVSEKVAKALNQLDAGTYYLDSYVPAIKNQRKFDKGEQGGAEQDDAAQEEDNPFENNVNEFYAGSYIEVTVNQTTNSWKNVPYVIGWAYQGFNLSNFHAGEPTYFDTKDEDGESVTVKYALYSGTDTSDTTKKKFEFTDVSTKEDDFKALRVGQYTVVASYKGTTNYADMSLNIFFSVAQAANSWTKAPYMIGWTYGSFSTSNFQGGVARFPDNGQVVTYKLYKEKDDEAVDGVSADGGEDDDWIELWKDPFTSIDETVQGKFEALGAGQYKLVAAVAGTTDYAALSQNIFFNVSQTENGWKTTPRMLGWTYQGFLSGEGGNFQAGVPNYFNTPDEKVEYKLYSGTDTSASGIVKRTLTVTKKADGDKYDMSDDDAAYFKALDAGTYTLVASYKGTADYGDLSLSMIFSVAKAENTWTTTPSIVGWTFGTFSKDIFKGGIANFNTEGATYKLYVGTDTSASGIVKRPLTVTKVEANNEVKYEMSDDDVTYFKKDLHPDTYTIYAHIDEGTNYFALSASMTFRVSQANNTWDTTPFMTGWAYTSFVAGTNFRAGIAANATGNAVIYTLYQGDKITSSSTEEFHFTDITALTGKDEKTTYADKFKALPYGTYTLVAFLKGNVDYADMTLSMTFRVSQANNTWDTTPSVIGWTFGGYDEKLFTAGKAAFTTDGVKVQYTLFKEEEKDGQSTSTKQWGPVDDVTVNSTLGGLGAGQYRLVASYAGTTDYAELSLDMTFNVTQAQNTWNPTPSVIGWTFGSYDERLFTAGGATFPKKGAVIQYTLFKEENKNGQNTSTKQWGDDPITDVSIVRSKLKALGAAQYKLVAEVTGTADYSALSLSIYFSVAQVDNGWTQTPFMTGWAYKGFDVKTNFQNGKAERNTEGKKVEYILYKGTGTTEQLWDDHFTDITALTGEDGKTTYADKFTALPVGTYTLVAELEGTNDYADLRLSMVFNVTIAENNWNPAPVLVGWQYNNFQTDNNNFRAAGAVFNEDKDKKITYVLTKGIKTSDTSMAVENSTWTLEIDEYGKLTATTVDTLNELHAGAYTLTVSLTGTTNYSGLSVNILLNITQAGNSLQTGATMQTEWTYNDSLPDTLLTEGTARYGTFVYTVYTVDSDGGVSASGKVPGFINLTKKDLTSKLCGDDGSLLMGLNAGSYNLRAEVIATDDYAAVSQDLRFTVKKAQNSWKTAPTIPDWTFGNTPSSHNTPEATVDTGNEITYAYYGAKLESGISSVDYGSHVADISSALAGYYAMVVTLKGNENYDDLVTPVYFNIDPQKIKWVREPDDIEWELTNTDPDFSNITDVLVATENNQDINSFRLIYTVKLGTAVLHTITVDVTVKAGKAEGDFSELFAALKALEVARYSIVVAVAVDTTGATSIEKNVSANVKLAKPDITVKPGDGSGSGNRIKWEWGNNDKKIFNEIEVAQDGAVITYRIGFDSTWSKVYTDFEEMLKDLRSRDASEKEYIVEYTVTCENYATVIDYIYVNIDPSVTLWDESTLFASTSWTYGSFDAEKLKRPKANFGDDTIVYTITKGGSVFRTFRAEDYKDPEGMSQLETDTRSLAERVYAALIEDMAKWGAGEYTITFAIAKTVNYSAPQNITRTIQVDKIAPKWDNTTDSTDKTTINKPYDYDYSGDLPEPKLGSASWGKTAVYTLRASNASGSLYSGGSWSALLAELKKCEADTYVVTAEIDGDDNHAALTYTLTIIISVKANSWKQNENSGGADRDSAVPISWTYGSETAPVIKFGAEYNGDKMVVRVGLVGIGGAVSQYEIVSYSNLGNYIKGLSAGTYFIYATVDADYKYSGLESWVSLVIEKANNEWLENESGDGVDLIISNWIWSEFARDIDTHLILPIAKQGDSVSIAVYKKGGITPEFTVIVAFVTGTDGKNINTNDRAALISELCRLGVGEYTITATVNEQTNYKSLSGDTAKTVNFKVEQATNRWTTAPAFFMGTQDVSNGWVYGSNIVVNYAPYFGNATVTYSTENGSENWTAMPSTVGDYKAVFSVVGTDNYKALTKTVFFTISPVTNREFSASPGVTDWAWNNYDEKNNLFTGTPVSLGEVRFEVREGHEGGAALFRKFQLFNDVGGKGIHTGSFAQDKYVEPEIAAELNKLTQGTYTLRLYVAARDNYDAFEYETSFIVTEAKNAWVETPKITAWYFGSYNDDVNAPTATALYGKPNIVIRHKDTGEMFYRYTGVEETYDRLADAKVGWYKMTVTVNGIPDQYGGLEEIIEFQVFVNSDQNFWVTVPSIEGWTANIDETVVMPTGLPFRGLPYFEFYKAVYENDEYQLKEKVEKGEDSFTVDNSRKYARIFYIPTAPGTYFMLSYAENESNSNDYLGVNHSSRIMFTIRDRVIAWDQSVRISSVLYLGERAKWAGPTARTNLTGDDTVKITYRYLDALTRRDLGSQIPTVAGKYIVVAYASARYTQTITSEMMFEVALSKNSWVGDSSPSIESWSEEFSGNSPNPIGDATYGEITYIYINKDRPDIFLTDRPTAAGRYIMIARVELDGYETLEARYEFTIAPAFDNTFMLIDIILGVVACAFAVVVIIFAIRRYKENG